MSSRSAANGFRVLALLALLLAEPGIASLEEPAGAAAALPESQELARFRSAFDQVRAHYVDKTDDARLIEGALAGMLRSLDPHSDYLNAQAFRDAAEEARGVFGGLGMEVSSTGGLVKVVALTPRSHVEAAGIRIGDIITHLDHASIRGLTITQVVEKMRGPVNSKVVVTVERGGPAGSVEVSATRDLIRVMTVHAGLEGGDVGYIQIAKFNGQTFEGLKSAVDRLSAQISSTKLKGYIIDLRNNPGGLVNQAVLVANAFVQGEVVSTRGRDSEMHRLGVDSGPRDMARGKPIIVLINGGSASAAEIVAGALQDHKRATILGTRSFGKGSVQTVTPLGKEAGALKLTTAWYVTPAGRFIQARGIAPDIEVAQDVPANASTRPDFGSEAALRGHLPVAGEGQEQDGSQSYVPQDRKKDKALTTALELLRGSQLHPAFPPKREASR